MPLHDRADQSIVNVIATDYETPQNMAYLQSPFKRGAQLNRSDNQDEWEVKEGYDNDTDGQPARPVTTKDKEGRLYYQPPFVARALRINDDDTTGRFVCYDMEFMTRLRERHVFGISEPSIITRIWLDEATNADEIILKG